MLIIMLQASGFLRFFAQDREVDGWEDVATSWIVAALVIAIVCTGIMLIIKWLIKKQSGHIRARTWTRGKTTVFILSGWSLVLLGALIVYYASLDFTTIIGVTGLLKGVLFSWILYSLFMLVSHALSPWRRDLY